MVNQELLEKVILVVRDAGKAILTVYATDFNIRNKGDSSPVTDADEKAEKIILDGLAAITPEIPIVSEEEASKGRIPRVADRFWLVDPLDGTKEFVNRNGEFTVNVALIEGGKPVVGVVFAPALDRLFAGFIPSSAFVEEKGERRAIKCRCAPSEITVVASRSHGDVDAINAYLKNKRVASYVSAGSSLKFCMVAAGEADIYPRFGRTMEWDTAAGHAVLIAAGGDVTQPNGEKLSYGKPGFDNPHFVASGCGF